ncbi:MAG: hypothetical protein H6811_02800 [Phycisphaeraceae bacterium]|nr:hypothetical protein [Phycisphaeraceae bacterium]
MDESHLRPLRSHHLTDEQIVVAVQIIAYFNGINRVADALGVDPESWMTLSRAEWLAGKGRDYLRGL